MTEQWTIEGTYLDSCNCDVICPCRAHGDHPGGDSTYDRCEFALSWMVDRGHYGDTDLSDRRVVLTGWYADDEPRSPWRVKLYVDDEATPAQHDALAAIYLGRVGGHPANTFAAAIQEVHAIESADIRIDYSPRRWSSTVDSRVAVRAAAPASEEGAVVCGISGPEHPGTEYTAELMRVNDSPLEFEFAGRAAFVSSFRYSHDQ